MYTFCGSQICKKSKFSGARPRPHWKAYSTPPYSWWEGAAGCPLPQNPTPCYRPFGFWASAISGFAHVRPLSEVHTPWENFLDKSPLGLCVWFYCFSFVLPFWRNKDIYICLLGLLLIGKWSWVRAIGRRCRHTESQYCPTPDDVLTAQRIC